MNTSIHATRVDEVQSSGSGPDLIGMASFTEQRGRTGTLSMFFDSADDVQAAANALASLAKQMRKREREAA